MRADPAVRGSDERRPLSTWAAGILAANPSPVQALLIDGANPVFATPPAWRVRDALLKVPFIASFGSFLDETSVLADLVLPDHSFLESWTDGRAESGAATAVATLAPPAMRPLHQTRAMPDVLLEVAGRLARPLNPPLPWQTFEEMLMAAFSALPAASAEADAWTAAQQQGGWWGELAGGLKAVGPGHAALVSGNGPADRSTSLHRAAIRRRCGAVPLPFPALSRRRRFSTARSPICRGSRKCRT